MIIKGQPKFETKDAMIDWLAEHSDDLIYEAKGTVKEADGIEMPTSMLTDFKADAEKSSDGKIVPIEEGVIKARLVINTTNIMDSHKDVHIPGIWNKSLKENKRIKHKQEHGHRFKDIISDKDDLKAFTKNYEWKDLGYDVEGKTEALVFDSTIRKNRNEEMYREYKDGNVDNHSVGMMYGKMLFAANSDKEEHAQYKINWDKYYPMIVNQKEAEKTGFFWPVLEAKVREGSAVPDGSNPITPTLSRKTHLDEKEAAAKSTVEYKEFIKSLKI